MITKAQFQAMARCSPETADLWYQPVIDSMARWKINSDKRVAAFIAQTSHECANYSRFVENLNYSAQALADTWPTKFAVVPKARPRSPNQLAWQVNRQPEPIANIVYADRFGNGDTASGDGWRYRGRGPIQITFLSNYADCGAAIGIDIVSDPDWLMKPMAGALSAGWYWCTRKCNEFIDDDDFVECTRAINKALLGLEERQARYKANLAIIGAPQAGSIAQLLSTPPKA